MEKFTCEYIDGADKGIKNWKMKIEAESPRAAYEKFLDVAGLYGCEVMVDIGIFDSIFFSDHLKDFEKQKKQRERALEAKRMSDARAEAEHFHSLLSEALKEIETKSYLELEVEHRIMCSGYFNDLIATFEKRSLLPIEIKFIKSWQNLKDRELGESLLAKNEMAKPKAQQGKSPLGNMLMAGMAMSTMRLSHDIGEVSDQVENISEGFGFEE
jgi:hypothetical protein